MKQKIRENYLKIRKKKYFELSQKNKTFIAKQVTKLCIKYKIILYKAEVISHEL